MLWRKVVCLRVCVRWKVHLICRAGMNAGLFAGMCRAGLIINRVEADACFQWLKRPVWE